MTEIQKIQKDLLEKNIAAVRIQVEEKRFQLAVGENTLAFMESQLEALNGSNP